MIRKTVKNIGYFTMALSFTGLVFLFLSKIHMRVDINELSLEERVLYDLGQYKPQDTIFNYIMMGCGLVIILISYIIDFIWCRCNYCNHHIKIYDIFRYQYCPYCSKSIDSTKEEAEKELKNEEK